MTAEDYMRRAISLAAQGAGWTSPNPLVGAVIVKDGRIIGEGYHERCGDLHAERNALAHCTENPAGATIYVTLEPCCHTGKQPPCTEAVIESGISKVVAGSRDPNPLVAGKGNEQLRAAGIEVEADFLRAECDALNPVFFKFIRTGLPYIVAKWAMTADGKIATASGDARWVSNETSRADTHDLRHRLSAIMIGIGTVLADDPALTCRRSIPSRQPLRVVCDSKLHIPEDCQLVKTAQESPVLVATAANLEDGTAADKTQCLQEAGVEVVSLPGIDGRVDLAALMTELGSRQIDSVLLEGGGTMHAAAFAQGLVDELVVYLAPKVCGGADAKTPVAGPGVELMADAWELGEPEVSLLDGDVKLVWRKREGN